jgi:maltooligosyltrehalose trehalohydrolase
MLSSYFINQHWYFTVWAPEKKRMTLHIVEPFNQKLSMQKNEEGYFTVSVKTQEKNLRYYFKPDDEKDYPDPASQYQPDGVHGSSQTVDHSVHQWNDNDWRGLPLEELVIYELHVGTFTQEGTFEAIIPRLADLRNLGINAIELMPIAQFPGRRNWGYDGVYPYAVQNSYGGPEGLKKLVDACHQKEIAVVLDVVYNHLGPEGNYFPQFGPYFTGKYCTPWGDALNFDDAWSDGVRDYFSDNVIHWLENYHIDGLRCDAIHTVFDYGAVHFWELTRNKVKQFEQKSGRKCFLIAESDLNSPRVIKRPEEGGYGFDAQWLDDFHHSLHTLLNPADKKRYYDFGAVEQLMKAYNNGFVHSGEWVRFRKRKHGASSAGIPGNKFVVFNQNHDQIGNRADGGRLSTLIDFERIKLAAAAVLLAPYIPMLFMGEEYAEETPFFYFVDHGDQELIRAVQEGRKKEFEDFGFDESVPDPQAETTFFGSKMNWEKRSEQHHQIIWLWYQELIRLRKNLAPLRNFQKRDIQANVINEKAFVLFRHAAGMEEKIISIFNFGEKETEYTVPAIAVKLLDSREEKWMSESKEFKHHPDKIKMNQPILLQPLSVVVYSSL